VMTPVIYMMGWLMRFILVLCDSDLADLKDTDVDLCICIDDSGGYWISEMQKLNVGNTLISRGRREHSEHP